MSAHQRLKMSRYLLGLTRMKMAEMLSVSYNRYCVVEQGRGRVAEDEFRGVADALPEFLFFLANGQPLSIEALQQSDNPYCLVAAAKLKSGDLADGMSTKDFIDGH